MSDEKNSSYRGFTEAQARAHKKYIAQFVEMKIRTTPERRETIQSAAASQGQSVNAYINQAIDERMKRDGGGTDGGAEGAQDALERVSGSGVTPIPSGAETPSKTAQGGVEGG